MINIGGNIGEVYVGSTKIAEAYVGSQLVYSAGPQYDAEIEYLESTGTQYIDTGLTTSYGRALQVKVQQTNISKNQIFGSGGASKSLTYAIRFYRSATNGVHANVSGTNFSKLQNVDTAIHTFKIDIPNLTIQFDNKTQTITSDMSYANRNYKEALYAYCYIGSLTSTNSYNFIGRVYWAKYWEAGELVRDYVPVRVGTVGYMYDKISGRLFGNAGTGSFTLGPDI